MRSRTKCLFGLLSLFVLEAPIASGYVQDDNNDIGVSQDLLEEIFGAQQTDGDSSSACAAPGQEDQEPCSGNGECKWGVCHCDQDYNGQFCENCEVSVTLQE